MTNAFHAVRFRAKGAVDQIGPPVGISVVMPVEAGLETKIRMAEAAIIAIYNLAWYQIQVDSIVVTKAI